ncbi:Lcl domain-containing protein [Vreelandella sp. EE22]
MADYLSPSEQPQFSDTLRAISEQDPAHPDTWNPQNLALLNNDQWLRTAIQATRQQVDDILGSDPINMSDRLDALVEYGAQRVFVERREQVPSFVINSAVGGDDSIDLETTEGVEPGQHYFINDAGNIQTVRVARVLSANRITLVATLLSTVAPGSELSRIAPTEYVTPALQDMERGAHLHAQGDDLSARHWTGSAWQTLAQRPDGSWDIPSNVERLRVSGAVSRVAVITALPIGVTRRPGNVEPADGATGVTATPALTGGAYYPLYGVPQERRRFWVFEAGGDSPIYEADELASGSEPAISHAVGQPVEIGASHEWQYQDKNVEGEWGQRSARTRFSTASTYVEAPTVVSPAASTTNVPEQPVIELSEFSVINGTDTHVATSLRIKDASGAVVWQLDRSTRLDKIDVPAGVLQPGARQYTIEPRHHGEAFGDSAWGAATRFTTDVTFVPDFEAEIGAPYGGGYVAGTIVSDYDGHKYGLIVSDGGGDSVVMGYGTMKWGPVRTLVSGSPGVPPMTLADGRANHNAILAKRSLSAFPAFRWIEDTCNAGEGLNGHKDWYLPSRDELEVIYRNFKPTTQGNDTRTRVTHGFGGDDVTHGTNVNSRPPGTGYTSASPAQTQVANFQSSNEDAFSATRYWSSTELDASYAWYQYFDTGTQARPVKDGNFQVRAVRRIAL